MEQLGGPYADQDPAVRGWLDFSSAVRRYFQWDRWAAFGLFQRAAASFEEAGERQHVLAMTHIQICQCYRHFGAYVESRRVAEALLARHDPETLGAKAGRAFLAFSRSFLGEVDEGIQGLQKEIDLATADDNNHTVGNLRSQLATIYLHRGDIEAAEREAMAAIDLLARSQMDLIATLATLADARLKQRCAASALSAVERARAVLRAFPPDYAVSPHLELVHAEALDAMGDHARAQEMIAVARADLLARAEQISDPGVRRSFLEDVPENARTVARAEAWLGPIRSSS